MSTVFQFWCLLQFTPGLVVLVIWDLAFDIDEVFSVLMVYSSLLLLLLFWQFERRRHQIGVVGLIFESVTKVIASNGLDHVSSTTVGQLCTKNKE